MPAGDLNSVPLIARIVAHEIGFHFQCLQFSFPDLLIGFIKVNVCDDQLLDQSSLDLVIRISTFSLFYVWCFTNTHICSPAYYDYMDYSNAILLLEFQPSGGTWRSPINAISFQTIKIQDHFPCGKWLLWRVDWTPWHYTMWSSCPSLNPALPKTNPLNLQVFPQPSSYNSIPSL